MRLTTLWASRLLLLLALLLITHLATTAVAYPLISDVYDKLQHLLAFLVLALLADLAFPETSWGWKLALPLLGYGLAIELIQAFLPYRLFSLADLAADGLGLLLYTFTLPWLMQTPLKRLRQTPAGSIANFDRPSAD